MCCSAMLSSKLAGPLVRQLSSSSSLSVPIKNVTIIGAGLMGSGIAQVSAAEKLNVVLVDQNEDILKKAKDGISASLSRVAKKKFPDDKKAQALAVEETLSHLKTTTSTAEGVKDADLVIEAIVENLDVKLKLFAEVEKNAKSSAILTSNTSSLRLVDIAVNIKNKSQFGGLHFFNPVPVMKLLEIVRHEETSEATYNDLVAYGKKIGKTTVVCKDTPGFIVNRLLVPYMFEAMRLAERGDATPHDIDTAMKLGAGYPMGPFELSDYVGLDTTFFIGEVFRKAYPDNPLFAESPMLKKLVKEGKLGRKNGEGFYKYK